MNRKWTHWSAGISVGIFVLALGILYQGRMIGNTTSPSARTCPYHVQLGPQTQMEIVRMSFTNRIEGLLGQREFPDQPKEEYRFAVVTLKITKPAGESLSLAAADLTLHYYHGSEMEVAPCEGLSWFKSEAESDSPILMNPIPGPGFIKQINQPGRHERDDGLHRCHLRVHGARHQRMLDLYRPSGDEPSPSSALRRPGRVKARSRR